MTNSESFGAARLASINDLDELHRLETLAATLAAPERGGAIFLGLDARQELLESLLENANATVVVGTIDGVPVGYAVATTEVLVDKTLIAAVSDLFVEPDARQVGVGEALMDLLTEWATARQCIGIDATALPGDRHTKNFFESFGLVARAIQVHRSLR
jgi:GNAT superfamily N-acetyltransferase